MKRLGLQIVMCFAFAFALSSQTTITLTPSEDAAIGFHDGANTAGNNYGGAQQNAAFWIPSVAAPPPGVNGNRALIKFALSTIPANATVTSAFINLYSIPLGSYSGHFGPNNASVLERITQNWGEYTATWNNQPPSTSLNSVTLPQSTSAGQNYLNINVLNLVLDMINNPGTSYGFKLKLINESITNGLLFGSKEHSNPNVMPKLVITYIDCTSQPLQLQSSPASVCVGSTVSLTANGTASSSVVWYATATSTLPLGNGTYVPPVFNTPGNYTFYGSGTCAGAPRTPVSVTIFPLPAVSATASRNNLCAGETILLSGSGANNYSWMSNAGVLAYNSAIMVTPSITTTYSLTGYASTGCTGTATLTVNVNPLPIVNAQANQTTICPGGQVILSASGASTYTWTINTFVFSNSNAAMVSPTVNTLYVLTGSNAAGCVGSSSVTIQVSKCQGISQNNSENAWLSVFPNPAMNRIHLLCDNCPSAKFNVTLTSADGSLIGIYELNTDAQEIDISHLPAGLYYCGLAGENQWVAMKRIIIIR